MLNKEQILDALSRNNEALRRLGVKRIGLFGSYVRGEQTESSDLDILVAFQPEAETFDNLMKLSYFLEQLFPSVQIELITENGLSPYIGPRILQEVSYAKIPA
jgi:predicted nucleotidyltransferase